MKHPKTSKEMRDWLAADYLAHLAGQARCPKRKRNLTAISKRLAHGKWSKKWL